MSNLIAAPPDARRRREFGHIFKRKGSRFLWVRYRVDGKTYAESTHSTSERDAAKYLSRKQAELGLGVFVSPDVRRTTFEDLVRLIEDDYVMNGRRSTERLAASVKHLRAAFAGNRAVNISADRLSGYVRDRLGAKAAPSTVRNELNVLRRAFRLARRAGRVTQVPEFPQLRVSNTRTGFFEAEDFAALLTELPEALRGPVEFAYLTGWRIPSEVLRLRWAQVDFVGGVIRLEVGTTKNGEGRVFPFGVLPRLKALIERQRDVTRAVERRRGEIVPWVFHRGGRPIRSFHDAWRAACERAATDRAGGIRQIVRAALLGRIPHDLRRTAVRNLVRAGVPERVAMQLTGHKTRSVFDRYNIVSERDLAEGVAKLALVQGTVAR